MNCYGSRFGYIHIINHSIHVFWFKQQAAFDVFLYKHVYDTIIIHCSPILLSPNFILQLKTFASKNFHPQLQCCWSVSHQKSKIPSLFHNVFYEIIYKIWKHWKKILQFMPVSAVQATSWFANTLTTLSLIKLIWNSFASLDCISFYGKSNLHLFNGDDKTIEFSVTVTRRSTLYIFVYHFQVKTIQCLSLKRFYFGFSVIHNFSSNGC